MEKIYNKKNIIAGVINRPPNTDNNVFNDKLDNILDTIIKEGKLCYIMGDYNINILNSEIHQGTNEFVNMMSSYAFVSLISRPTRVTAYTATLIDNIFTNDIVDFGYSINGVLVSDISDHYPVFHINHECKLNECETFMYRKVYSKTNRHFLLHSNTSIGMKCMVHVTLNPLSMCFIIVLLDYSISTFKLYVS